MTRDEPAAPDPRPAGVPRAPSLRTRVAWCFLAPVLVAGVLELVVVALDVAPRRSTPLSVWNSVRDGELDADDGQHRFDARWLWEPRPGAVIEGDLVNEDGLRGPRVPREPRPALRVAALGESVTFGMGVRAAEAWPAVLERLLRDRGLDAQVLNFGVIGHTLAQGRELYLRRASGWKPDVLVACFPGVNEASVAPGGLIDSVKMQLVQQENYRFRLFLDRFASVRWLASLGGATVAQDPLSHAALNARAPRVSVAHFTELLGLLADETGAWQCSLVLVSAARSGRGETVQPAVREYTAALEEVAARRAIPVADVRGAFAAAPQAEESLYLDAWHPTVEGHRLYATTIADALERAGALDR